VEDESQRNVTRLLAETIPEVAARRPFTVVLIDEVESFAVSRSAASFEANPVDVHRATDAVLLGIDEIARKLPSVLFVTTTNFIEAVDAAFLSRAYRENDYLLGRLHAIDRLIDIVSEAVGSESQSPAAVAALKRRGFLRILDVEESHLPTCEPLIAELRAALAADEAPSFKAKR
jgi:AAA+ superfamily predicted ATPase